MINPRTPPPPRTGPPYRNGGHPIMQNGRPRMMYDRPHIVSVTSPVVVPSVYGYYGDVEGVSPNQMYNRYLVGFMKKYGTSKTPLTFKEWIKWAKNKGLVDKYNADGTSTQETKEDTSDVDEKMKKAKKAIGWVVFAGVAALIIGMSLKK